MTIEIGKLQEENTNLKNALKQAAEQLQQLEFARIKKDHVTFCEDLVKSGSLKPVDKDSAVALLCALENASEHRFSKEDARNPVDVFKGFLSGLPKQIAPETATTSNAATALPAAAEFAAHGVEVDQDRLALHTRAIAIMTDKKCSYTEAVKAALKA